MTFCASSRGGLVSLWGPQVILRPLHAAFCLDPREFVTSDLVDIVAFHLQAPIPECTLMTHL
jgi:hypothetical protein